MQFYGLIGEKLGHSLSEPIHKMFFSLTGIEAAYRLIEVKRGDVKNVPAAMKTLDFAGMNVTIPYKQVIMPYLDDITPSAKNVGAVNTLFRRDGQVVGHNSDVYGLTALLGKNGISLENATVALLGATGGVAQAAIECVRAGGAKKMYLVSRSPEERSLPHPFCEWVTYEQLRDVRGNVLINGTPVGMYPNTGVSAADEETVTHFAAVVDTVYNPAETEIMRLARKHGVQAVNGLYMLVAQAMESESVWQQMPVDPAITDEIYRELKRQFEGEPHT